jgi:7-cyano-7-deazaguanine synthase
MVSGLAARRDILEALLMTTSARPAVVLLSGGLDSATVLAAARRDGFRCHALSINYGQRHAAELDAARRVAAALGAVEHRIIQLDLRAFGGSALTANLEVPKDRSEETMASGIPITYVPARNTVFLALALAWAETLGSFDLYVGVNAIDYSGYPDCRPEFLAAFENLANLATKAGVEKQGRFQIHAPLVQLSKADIIRLGVSLGVDYSLTHSCYDPAPGGPACGRCDSCRLRRAGFAAAGVADPTRYAASVV